MDVCNVVSNVKLTGINQEDRFRKVPLSVAAHSYLRFILPDHISRKSDPVCFVGHTSYTVVTS